MTESNAKKDPRYRNRVLEGNSVTEYYSDYQRSLQAALKSVDTAVLEKVFDLFKKTMLSGHHVLAAGNGGSAAITDHLCCDFTKGTHLAGKAALKSRSLVSNTPVLTAFANDFGYENSISAQIEMLASKGDVLLVISSSGNSPNVVNAIHAARQHGLSTIGMTGFSGGEIRKHADHCLHVDFPNYGIVEDCHQILMHTLSQYLIKIRETI